MIEKTEEDRDITFPRKLIAFAEAQKDNPEISFDKERDKMIVVFDADIFETKVQDYDEVVALGEVGNILAVTNPAFELFLLLHFEGSYESDIVPHEEEIIKNEKDGIRLSFTSYYLLRQELTRRRIQRLVNWRKKWTLRLCKKKRLTKISMIAKARLLVI